MEENFKEGDLVRIIGPVEETSPNYSGYKMDRNSWVPDMNQWIGKELFISRVLDNNEGYRLDGCEWSFSQNWIERIRSKEDNDISLHSAAENGDLETVKYLVENGADIHADNNVPLCCAARYGHFEIVKYLIENGADVHAWDDEALGWAAEYGNLEIVEFLIKNGANIDVLDDYPTIKSLLEEGIHNRNSHVGSESDNDSIPDSISKETENLSKLNIFKKSETKKEVEKTSTERENIMSNITTRATNGLRTTGKVARRAVQEGAHQGVSREAAEVCVNSLRAAMGDSWPEVFDSAQVRPLVTFLAVTMTHYGVSVFEESIPGSGTALRSCEAAMTNCSADAFRQGIGFIKPFLEGVVSDLSQLGLNDPMSE